MSLFFKKTEQNEEVQERLSKFSRQFLDLKAELDDLKNKLDKLEISALESRKIYKKKLQQAFGDEEKSNDGLGNSVLLPER